MPFRRARDLLPNKATITYAYFKQLGKTLRYRFQPGVVRRVLLDERLLRVYVPSLDEEVDMPARYLSCNHRAFQPRDKVVVFADNCDYTKMTVIGFQGGARPCGWLTFVTWGRPEDLHDTHPVVQELFPLNESQTVACLSTYEFVVWRAAANGDLEEIYRSPEDDLSHVRLWNRPTFRGVMDPTLLADVREMIDKPLLVTARGSWNHYTAGTVYAAALFDNEEPTGIDVDVNEVGPYYTSPRGTLVPARVPLLSYSDRSNVLWAAHFSKNESVTNPVLTRTDLSAAAPVPEVVYQLLGVTAQCTIRYSMTVSTVDFLGGPSSSSTSSGFLAACAAEWTGYRSGGVLACHDSDYHLLVEDEHRHGTLATGIVLQAFYTADGDMVPYFTVTVSPGVTEFFSSPHGSLVSDPDSYATAFGGGGGGGGTGALYLGIPGGVGTVVEVPNLGSYYLSNYHKRRLVLVRGRVPKEGDRTQKVEVDGEFHEAEKVRQSEAGDVTEGIAYARSGGLGPPLTSVQKGGTRVKAGATSTDWMRHASGVVLSAAVDAGGFPPNKAREATPYLSVFPNAVGKCVNSDDTVFMTMVEGEVETGAISGAILAGGSSVGASILARNNASTYVVLNEKESLVAYPVADITKPRVLLQGYREAVHCYGSGGNLALTVDGSIEERGWFALTFFSAGGPTGHVAPIHCSADGTVLVFIAHGIFSIPSVLGVKVFAGVYSINANDGTGLRFLQDGDLRYGIRLADMSTGTATGDELLEGDPSPTYETKYATRDNQGQPPVTVARWHQTTNNTREWFSGDDASELHLDEEFVADRYGARDILERIQDENPSVDEVQTPGGGSPVDGTAGGGVQRFFPGTWVLSEGLHGESTFGGHPFLRNLPAVIDIETIDGPGRGVTTHNVTYTVRVRNNGGSPASLASVGTTHTWRRIGETANVSSLFQVVSVVVPSGMVAPDESADVVFTFQVKDHTAGGTYVLDVIVAGKDHGVTPPRDITAGGSPSSSPLEVVVETSLAFNDVELAAELGGSLTVSRTAPLPPFTTGDVALSPFEVVLPYQMTLPDDILDTDTLDALRITLLTPKFFKDSVDLTDRFTVVYAETYRETADVYFGLPQPVRLSHPGDVLTDTRPGALFEFEEIKAAFQVSANSDAPSGTYSVRGGAAFYHESDPAKVSHPVASDPGGAAVLVVQAPARLLTGSAVVSIDDSNFVPGTIRRKHRGRVTFDVTNEGEAAALVPNIDVLFQIGSADYTGRFAIVASTGPAQVNGGQTASFMQQFEVTAFAFTGSHDVSLRVKYVDANSGDGFTIDLSPVGAVVVFEIPRIAVTVMDRGGSPAVVEGSTNLPLNTTFTNAMPTGVYPTTPGRIVTVRHRLYRHDLLGPIPESVDLSAFISGHTSGYFPALPVVVGSNASAVVALPYDIPYGFPSRYMGVTLDLAVDVTTYVDVDTNSPYASIAQSTVYASLVISPTNLRVESAALLSATPVKPEDPVNTSLDLTLGGGTPNSVTWLITCAVVIGSVTSVRDVSSSFVLATFPAPSDPLPLSFTASPDFPPQYFGLDVRAVPMLKYRNVGDTDDRTATNMPPVVDSPVLFQVARANLRRVSVSWGIQPATIITPRGSSFEFTLVLKNLDEFAPGLTPTAEDIVFTPNAVASSEGGSTSDASAFVTLTPISPVTAMAGGETRGFRIRATIAHEFPVANLGYNVLMTPRVSFKVGPAGVTRFATMEAGPLYVTFVPMP